MDPETIALLEDDVDMNIKLWLTESAFREIGHKPWILKWAQSLVNIQNYSLMLRNPYVEIIMLNALHGWYSTSAINHGNQFPDEFPPYVDQDSCSPYGRTATAFSIYFWNYISEGMTHMQELIFNSDNGEHLGVITENPFEGEDADSNQSPEVDSLYSYLMGWKFNNTSSGEEKAIIINVADTPKTIQYDVNAPIFNSANMCIHITSLNSDGVPSIDQYINGDGDLHYDTTDVVSGMVIPAYSVNLFEHSSVADLSNHFALATPSKFALLQNYPNPFNPTTTISYDIADGGHVELSVYNINGQLIETLVNTHMSPGYYSTIWNGDKGSSGLYICRLSFGNQTITQKMLLMK